MSRDGLEQASGCLAFLLIFWLVSLFAAYAAGAHFQ